MLKSNPMHLSKVISGGQTGVDRAGLDVAIQFGLQIGGTAPLDAWAEDGRAPADYGLTALSTEPLQRSIDERTIANVRDSDATLILRSSEPSPGTDFTEREVARQGKPPGGIFVIEESATVNESMVRAAEIADWIDSLDGSVLNIAGPRESEARLYRSAHQCLTFAFEMLQSRNLLACDR